MVDQKLPLNIPKYYADANSKRNPKLSNYDNVEITYGKQENYQAIRKIGRGKYSEVFEGINIINNQKCVVKGLKPIRIKKI